MRGFDLPKAAMPAAIRRWEMDRTNRRRPRNHMKILCRRRGFRLESQRGPAL